MVRKDKFLENAPFAELQSSDGSARIRIYTYSYEFPEKKGGYDADWHMNYISLCTGGVSVKIDAPIIEGRVLKRLLKEMISFRELKTPEVDVSFTEPEFSFTMSNKPLIDKNISISGEITDIKPGRVNYSVRFQFETDLELINDFINGIELILNEYPPRY